MMKNIETLIEQYIEILNKNRDNCKLKCQELTNDNRKDEADLEKIKLNIYDVFSTLVEATEKQILSKENINETSRYEAFCNAYLQVFDKIPQSWKIRLENAKKNNAVVEIVIEETKLSTANELKNIFSNLI